MQMLTIPEVSVDCEGKSINKRKMNEEMCGPAKNRVLWDMLYARDILCKVSGTVMEKTTNWREILRKGKKCERARSDLCGVGK
jgi:hypothetical protein